MCRRSSTGAVLRVIFFTAETPRRGEIQRRVNRAITLQNLCVSAVNVFGSGSSGLDNSQKITSHSRSHALRGNAVLDALRPELVVQRFQSRTITKVIVTAFML